MFSRMLRNSFSPRLLKKFQGQGALTYPDGWVPAGARGARDTYGAAPHPSFRWVPGGAAPEVDLFQQPVEP